MAEDENGGVTQITNEAARGAFGTALAANVIGVSLIGSDAAVKSYDGKTLAVAKSISSAEAAFWKSCADKAPALVSRDAAAMSEQMKGIPVASSSFKNVLIGVGAVLGALTSTRYIPGKWKLLSGGVAVGSIASGFAIGQKVNNLNAMFASAIPEAKATLNTYAATLQNDPALRDQLAQYLSTHMTAQDLQANTLDDAIANKAIEFGQTTPHLDQKKFVDQIMEQASTSAKPDCKPCAGR